MIGDLRDWIATLEKHGQLYRLKSKVDWRGELAEIQRRVVQAKGPAILYENIKDYEKARSTSLFAGGLAAQPRVAVMLGLPADSPRQVLVSELRERLKRPVTPVQGPKGPVKQNILKGDAINLFDFPVPQWHPLDGGRYINTWGGVVTCDPLTGQHNVGLYRAAIGSRNKIKILIVPAQNVGIHYKKHQALGRPMPIAFVYGWDPSMGLAAGLHFARDEYDVMGAVRQQAVPLVRCETSDLLVPASAEIVIEGQVSPDPATYEVEGPYGEGTGYYGVARRRPVVAVTCITHRDSPIFRGAINEGGPIIGIGASALVWNMLDEQDIPGIMDVVVGSFITVKIRKTYQGQAKHVAAAIWGSRSSITMAKVVVVVDEESNIDIANPAQLQMAISNHLDPVRGVVIFPMELGAPVDPALSIEAADETAYGQGLGNKMLIDATVDWVTHPRREEWNGGRLSPNCLTPTPEVARKVARRWQQYGIPF